MLQRIKDRIVARWRSLDPKLVAAAVTYALTAVAAHFAIGLDGTIVPGYPLTVGQAIALAAAAVAGYWKGNDGTILRNPQESGNPVHPDGVELEERRVNL